MRSIRQRLGPPEAPANRCERQPAQHTRAPRFPGQSLVEFGLISLLLLTMVAGIVDLGRGVYARTSLSNAIREAAHYGATNPRNSDGIIAAAQNTSPGLQLATQPNLQDSFALNGGAIRCTDRNYVRVFPQTTGALPPLPGGLALGVAMPALAVQAAMSTPEDCISNYSFVVNGKPIGQTLNGKVNPGDRVRVTFTVAPTCSDVVASLTTWVTDSDGNIIDPENRQLADDSHWFERSSGTYQPGSY